MGTPRTRQRELTTYTAGSYQTGYYPGGVWTPIGAPTLGTSISNIHEKNDDTLAPYPFVEPHSLSIVKRKATPLRFYGEAALSSANVRRHSANGYNVTNWSGYIYVPIPAATDINYWKAKLWHPLIHSSLR